MFIYVCVITSTKPRLDKIKRQAPLYIVALIARGYIIPTNYSIDNGTTMYELDMWLFRVYEL